MASTASSAFIVALPKAELHLHLEGSIDPPTVLELKQRHGKKGTLAEVEELYRYKDFTGFLMAFKTVTEELQTPEDYELITYRLMEKLKADNVLHAEVYVSVGVCLWRKARFRCDFRWAGTRAGTWGARLRNLAALDFSMQMRQFGADKAQRVAELAARYKAVRAWSDSASAETERQAAPELFRDVYAYAATNGLRLTAHAGETAGPGSRYGGHSTLASRADRARIYRLPGLRAGGSALQAADSG